MYVIFKNNKRTSRKTFQTYEAARQYVRKLIRSNHPDRADVFWTTNPMIGDYGYSIKQT